MSCERVGHESGKTRWIPVFAQLLKQRVCTHHSWRGGFFGRWRVIITDELCNEARLGVEQFGDRETDHLVVVDR